MRNKLGPSARQAIHTPASKVGLAGFFYTRTRRFFALMSCSSPCMLTPSALLLKRMILFRDIVEAMLTDFLRVPFIRQLCAFCRCHV
jgi:hypothetical protein